MKCVGEVMAMEQTFEETIQKALLMVDKSCSGFDSERFDLKLSHRGTEGEVGSVRAELQEPSPTQMWAIAKAYEMGMTVEEVHGLTSIDRWCMTKLHHIHCVRRSLQAMDLAQLQGSEALLREAKRCGFADRQIAVQLRAGGYPSLASPGASFGSMGMERCKGGTARKGHVRYLRGEGRHPRWRRRPWWSS